MTIAFGDIVKIKPEALPNTKLGTRPKYPTCDMVVVDTPIHEDGTDKEFITVAFQRSPFWKDGSLRKRNRPVEWRLRRKWLTLVRKADANNQPNP